MSSVYTAEDSAAVVALAGGGKAVNLHRLCQGGLPVPAWAVIGTEVLRAFRSANGLGERIERALARPRPEDAGKIAARIAEMFADTPLDEDALAAIRRAYEHVGADAVAVRSSGVDEDRADLSFAGQYESFLNITGLDQVADRVKQCWASAYSERSLTYRWAHDLPTHPIEVAVVIQRIVPADVSGVMFTANPVSGRREEALISAVYGLGESLVSGAVDADTATVDRREGTVTELVIGDKRERVDPAADGSGVVTSPVDPQRRAEPALSPQRLERLRACADTVEKLFGAPQDIEWAITGDDLWILQSRPITGPTGDADVRVWDNSNIIESFGEVTAPLTFSFARYVYRKVYSEYCHLLGVPRSDLAGMETYLGNMLGYFDGRVYYNVLNWYRVIRLLPFYRLNRKILAAAMGVAETDEDLAERQHPLPNASPLHERLVRAWVKVRFTWMFFTVRRSVAKFIDHFSEVYATFDSVDYAGMRGDEVNRRLHELERRLLSRWGSTAVLDNVIFLTYGVLHAITGKWLPEAPEWFLWEIVKVGGAEDVESTLPARRLTALAGEVTARTGLAERVRELKPDALWTWLQESADADAVWLREELARYIDEFGYRNANELKLEEPDLHDDPSLLVSMLRETVARAAEPAPAASRPAGEGPSPQAAEAYLNEHLGGPRRWVYNRVRRKVQNALRERERVRLARTRAFGMARRMFKAIGQDLERVGALTERRDVFYLKFEEIREAYAGTIAHRELGPLAELRRGQQDEQRLMSAPPPRFITTGGPYWGRTTADVPRAEPADEQDENTLRGTPCSPGVVTATASVVDEPRGVDGGIVVTYRTDPGWVGVLTSASALLIERGSPLTHVAIVARELGVPTVVQIPDLTRRVQTGMRLTVDGGKGTIYIESDGN